MTLLQVLATRLTALGLRAEDVSRVIVPVDDPRVPSGELSVTPSQFAQAANQVQAADARRDILIGVQPAAVDEQGQPVIPPPEERIIGWVDGQFRVVRGPGAEPYPFGPNDLVAGA